MPITQRRVPTNGIELNIAECGSGPLVLLLHGFPESWYSWRHQLEPLADAGFHVVAPDMRGYGKSDRPPEIAAYNQVEVMADIRGLVPALGAEQAVVIGHDWGVPPRRWVSPGGDRSRLGGTHRLGLCRPPRGCVHGGGRAERAVHAPVSGAADADDA